MSTQELRSLQRHLLRVLRQQKQPLDADRLYDLVTGQAKWSSTGTSDVLRAVWNLVDQGKAEFAQGRKLQATQPQTSSR